MGKISGSGVLTADDIASEYGLFQVFHSSLMDKLNSGYQVMFYASDDGQYRCELQKGIRGFHGIGDTPRQALVRALGLDAQAMLWPEPKEKK